MSHQWEWPSPTPTLLAIPRHMRQILCTPASLAPTDSPPSRRRHRSRRRPRRVHNSYREGITSRPRRCSDRPESRYPADGGIYSLMPPHARFPAIPPFHPASFSLSTPPSISPPRACPRSLNTLNDVKSNSNTSSNTSIPLAAAAYFGTVKTNNADISARHDSTTR
ncbi:hypothetical protein R3P38DRAFT_3186905 [Favolaschia claudopus]|uniref:Uncharacterized protein n=1 Tax=Favolaschia claudopus TaxID=2862362 RepID=A0AAW0C2T3_9AGAR